MSNLQKYTELKEKVDKAKRERDRAAGALEQAEKQLKEQFDCNSLEEAEELLEAKQKDEARAEKKFEKAMTEFEEKWDE